MTKETYNAAVDTLLDAWNNGDLMHGNCAKCAVGNLLQTSEWGIDFSTGVGIQWDKRNSKFIKDNSYDYSKLDNLYALHGFTREELMKIEYAFENSVLGETYQFIRSKEGQYTGLCAVLDVMKDMVSEEVPHEENKERLTKVYKELV